MRSKTFGAACLVAGTAIGAGTLALPQLVAGVGAVGACGLLCMSWWVVYVTCLCVADLHMIAGRGHSFTRMCERLGGRGASLVASGAFLLMGYALMSAYSVGLMDLSQKIFDAPSPLLLKILFLGIFLMICLRIGIVESINRYALSLALGVLFLFGVLFLWKGRVGAVLCDDVGHISLALKTLPAIFTSFGCQIVIAPLVDYCDLDKVSLRRAFFYGTLAPLVVYCGWIVAALSVLKTTSLWDALRMGQDVALGPVMEALAQGSGFTRLAWWLQGVGFLAVLTSFFGVGVSLLEDIMQRSGWRRLPAMAIIAGPVIYVAFFSQAVFARILSVAGVINTVIAVFLPLYVMKRTERPVTLCASRFGRSRVWLWVSAFWATLVVVAEICWL